MAKVNKYSLKERINLEEIYERFLSLAPRERTFALGGIALFLFLVILLPISCASIKLADKEKNVLKHEEQMEKLLTKLKEYQEVTRQLKTIQSQWENRSQIKLSATLESFSNQNGLDKNFQVLKEQENPSGDSLSEQTVSVKLTQISLDQAVDYLYKVENSNVGKMVIKRLEVKPMYSNRALFDLSFDVSTYSIKKGEGS